MRHVLGCSFWLLLLLGCGAYVWIFVWFRNSLAPTLGVNKDLISGLYIGGTFVVVSVALVFAMTRNPDKG